MLNTISMRQLAKLAGVSVGTVSLALRDNPRISAATRQRIQVLAEQHGYRSNQVTRSLISGKTHTLGCILPSVTCTFYARLLRGVLASAFSMGCHVLILETHSRLLDTCKAIHALLGQRVDGILIASEHPATIPRETVREMVRRGAWPVSLDSTPFEEPVDEIRTDEGQLAETAVGYLFDMGHREIAYLGSVPGGRAQAMSDALQRRGLPAHYFFDAYADDPARFDMDAIYRALFRHTLPPTAIICWEDRMAARLIQHLAYRGVRVPQDVSVLGCANMDVANLTVPPLTSIEQDPEAIGRQAVELVIHHAAAPRSVIVPARLVIRASCAPRRGR
ncbi:MAG: LacI family DNA-binding transcriptional regulator [Armatimonadota bacterium]